MTAPGRIDELRKRYDENPRRFFAPLANEYRKSGDLDQAIALCEQHLVDQPGNMNGQVVYGQSLFEAGRHHDARAPFEAALALDPENLIALRHLGDVARLTGDSAEARRWYERVLEFDRRNDEVKELLAMVGGGEQAPQMRSSVNAASIISSGSGVSVFAPGESAPEPAELPRASTPPTIEVQPPRPAPPKRASLLDISLDFSEIAEMEQATTNAPIIEPPTAPTLMDLEPTSFASPDEASMPSFGGEMLDVEPTSFDAGALPPFEDPVIDPLAGLPTMDTTTIGDPGRASQMMSAIPDEPRDSGPVLGAEAAEYGFADEIVDPSAFRETPPPFVTETMAELYLEQGHRDKAIEVYRQLVAASPSDAALAAKLDALETPPAPDAAMTDVSFDDFGLTTPLDETPLELTPVIGTPSIAAVTSIASMSSPSEEVLVPSFDSFDDDLPPVEAVLPPLPVEEVLVPDFSMTADASTADALFGDAPAFLDEPEVMVPSFDDTPLSVPVTPVLVESIAAAPAELPRVSAMAIEVEPIVPMPDPEPVHTGPSAREFFATFARRGVAAVPTEAPVIDAAPMEYASFEAPAPAVVAEPKRASAEPTPAPLHAAAAGGSLDSLFHGGITTDDEAAALLMASVGHATPVGTPTGRPTAQAKTDFSLDSVFGGGGSAGSTPAHIPRASEKLRFDQFFATEAPPAPVAPAAPSAPGGAPANDDDEDLDQFQNWLQGLKT